MKHSADTSKEEVEKGKIITEQLAQARQEMIELADGATEIAGAAEQAARAALIVEKGSQDIAAAAEEQSAACEESVQTVKQQAVALRQSEKATEELSEVADALRTSTDIGKSAEEVASTAEELSAAVEEINRAAAQIMTAIGQISGSAKQSASRSQESSVAVGQIEAGARLAETRATVAVEKAQGITKLIGDNKVSVDEMIKAIGDASAAGRESVKLVNELELVSRRIDKIVDAIANVSIQTNMLAVNGSVESARAGDFGKGFAVVSTDIRNLARDSAENAERIKDSVKAVQDRIVQVRGDLDETSRQGLAEVERAKETTTCLEQVEREMGEALAGNQEVLSRVAGHRRRHRPDQPGDAPDCRRRQPGRDPSRPGRHGRPAASAGCRGAGKRDRRDRGAGRRTSERLTMAPTPKVPNQTPVLDQNSEHPVTTDGPGARPGRRQHCRGRYRT